MKQINPSDKWGMIGWIEALIRVIPVAAPVGFTEKFIFLKEKWDAKKEHCIPECQEWIDYAIALDLKKLDAGNYVVSRCQWEIANFRGIVNARSK
ncbi:MAG: hypothetical protein KGL39_25865 [Patescibacteria group bacterium]|nr:hypothetical protein [Patescibacteria group bacterium]